jgi:phosphate transport system permease protein
MSMQTTAAPAALGRQPTRKRVVDRTFKVFLWFSLGVGIVALATQLTNVVSQGAGSFGPRLWNRFPSTLPQLAGAESALFGTLWVVGITAIIAMPVGIGAAVYLEEFANKERWYNRAVELNIQNLAAVPSIVYGILGLAFLVRGPFQLGNVVLAGGLTLALLVLPMVIIAGREALRAVPPSIREGSLALGATQWQTIWRQVLPAAVPGIATGVILALSRAIGETAPLIVIGAVAVIAFNPSGLDSSFTAMPIQIFDWISRASNDINDYRPLAAAGILLLMILLLAMNSVAIWLRNRYEQKW